MPTLDAVLDRVDEVAHANRLPVVVFDLDSTLFRPAGRHLAILRAFARDEAPELEPFVERLELGDIGWYVEEPLRAVGFDHGPTFGRLKDYWYDRFFDGEWVRFDHPAPGAPDYVREVHRRGALVYYLTGRHVDGMHAGTAEALATHRFPLYDGRSVLHLKPAFGLPDKPFKDRAIDAIRSHRGEVVATFENEPPNAHLFLEAFPEAHHFLVGDVRNPAGEPPRPELLPIADFVPRDAA